MSRGRICWRRGCRLELGFSGGDGSGRGFCGGRGWRVGLGYLLNGREIACVAIGGDGLDGLGGGLLFIAEGEVGAGDLQAIEHGAGELGVDVSGGEPAEDVIEGDLDGGAVIDGLHAEDANAAGERGAGKPGTVVVVAEVLPAQGRRAAAAAIGVDVTAEVAALGIEVAGLGYGVGLHGVDGTPCTLVLKSW